MVSKVGINENASQVLAQESDNGNGTASAGKKKTANSLNPDKLKQYLISSQQQQIEDYHIRRDVNNRNANLKHART